MEHTKKIAANEKTVLIAQSRLSSTRLPKKALLPLGNTCTLGWALRNLRKLTCDDWILACDDESVETFRPIAAAAGFRLFSGSTDDVLKRFCDCIRHFRLENAAIVRATADNPFLFVDAAEILMQKFRAARCDYATFSGLPHGAGVEVFAAKSLLEAEKNANSAFEREHVCPALYLHEKQFSILKTRCPPEFFAPELRITIDNADDYEKAKRIAEKLIAAGETAGNSRLVMDAARTEKRQILFVPQTKRGMGTGHVSRCCELAKSCDGKLLIGAEARQRPQFQTAISAAKSRLVENCGERCEYSAIVTDFCTADEDFAFSLAENAPVIAIEDSATNLDFADFAIDALPPLDENHESNVCDPAFIPQPKNRRGEAKNIQTILVALGGEDPAALTAPAANLFASLGFEVSAIANGAKDFDAAVEVLPRVENLKEKLFQWDLVVTHYGFTAFEAAEAGCGVILLATTALHAELAKKHGFALLESIDGRAAKKILQNSDGLFPKKHRGCGQKSLADFIKRLSAAKRRWCPCGAEFSSRLDKVAERTCTATIRICHVCGEKFESFSALPEVAPKFGEKKWSK